MNVDNLPPADRETAKDILNSIEWSRVSAHSTELVVYEIHSGSSSSVGGDEARPGGALTRFRRQESSYKSLPPEDETDSQYAERLAEEQARVRAVRLPKFRRWGVADPRAGEAFDRYRVE